ncbi:hypothetical protein CR513_50607, partial [Mucuna pruriens]
MRRWRKCVAGEIALLEKANRRRKKVIGEVNTRRQRRRMKVGRWRRFRDLCWTMNSSLDFFVSTFEEKQRHLLHQLIATLIHYDFYNYDSEDKEFIQLFIKFTQFWLHSH